MESFTKLFITTILVIFATSCKRENDTETSLAGTWEYSIEISFEGTNYNTNQSISETKKFSGVFTWDEGLDGWLEGDIEYSYLMGHLDEGQLGFTEDNFRWSENGKEYEAFCIWNSVPATNSTKEFTTKSGMYSWVEVTYPDGNEIFCTDVDATLKARKIE